jgi:hypothetical protein
MLYAINTIGRNIKFRKSPIPNSRRYWDMHPNIKNITSTLPSKYEIQIKFNKNGDLMTKKEIEELEEIKKKKYLVFFGGLVVMLGFFINIMYERQPLRIH